jgi:repressor LexA
MIAAMKSTARRLPTLSPPPTLSPRQRQLVEVVERLTGERGYPPSCREIGEAMGVHHSRAHQLLSAAERRGVITRDPGKMRSVRVVSDQSR